MMPVISKPFKYIAVLLFYSLFLIASETLYRQYFAAPLLFNGIIEEWGFIVIITTLAFFAKLKLTKILICIFFFSSVVVNNIHYCVYQSWINATNYYLAVAEYREVFNGGLSMISKIIIPAMWGLFDFIVFSTIFFIRQPKLKYPIADIIFLLVFSIIIIRSINTSQEQGISPKDSYGRVKSNYYVTGYLLGRTLPYNLLDLSSIQPIYLPAPAKIDSPKIKNIVFLMGESAAASHWSSFGYKRETTPFVDELLSSTDREYFYLNEAFSAGMMTAVSLPSFFNSIPRPNGLNQINSGRTNLLRLAQEQGLTTYWYSSQPESEMNIINLIGKKYINHLTYPSSFGLGFKTVARDDILFAQLKALDLKKSNQNFIVLHQRGSHVPYGMLLTPDESIFGTKETIDAYDNTIFHTDSIIKQILKYMQGLGSDDWIFIYTSDHGQNVSKIAANQGSAKSEDSYVVPLLIYSPNKGIIEQAKKELAAPIKPFHHQLSVFIMHLLGYTNVPADNGETGFVTGNMITGDAGYLQIDSHGQVHFLTP